MATAAKTPLAKDPATSEPDGSPMTAGAGTAWG